MRLNPYLSFAGDCAEAFAFYAQCFGGKISFTMHYGDSPMAAQAPPDYHDKIMHTRLEIDGTTLMGSDAPPDRYTRPAGTMVCLSFTEPADADRVFAALAESGQISMPIQETFWARRFGMVTDRFGIPWMINCEKPA